MGLEELQAQAASVGARIVEQTPDAKGKLFAVYIGEKLVSPYLYYALEVYAFLTGMAAGIDKCADRTQVTDTLLERNAAYTDLDWLHEMEQQPIIDKQD